MDKQYTTVPIGTVFASLAGLYAGLCLAAFLTSGAQGSLAGQRAAAVFLVASLTLARYQAISAFARSLGLAGQSRALLIAGSWIICLLGLAVALVFIARRAHGALAWASVAACAGPASIALVSAFLGARAMLRGRGGPEKAGS